MLGFQQPKKMYSDGFYQLLINIISSELFSQCAKFEQQSRSFIQLLGRRDLEKKLLEYLIL